MYKFKHKPGFCPSIQIGDIIYYLMDEPAGTDCYRNPRYEYKLMSMQIPGPKQYLANHCEVLKAITGKNLDVTKLYKQNYQEKTGDEIAEWELYHIYRCMDKDVYKPLPTELIEHKMSFTCTLEDEHKQRWLWSRKMNQKIVKKHNNYILEIEQQHTIQKVYPRILIYPAKPYEEAKKDALDYLNNKYGYKEEINLF